MAWYYLLLWCAFGDSVRDLGAESFDARVVAEVRLARWAYLTWPLLDGQHRDLEVRYRSRRILARAGVGQYRPIAILSGRPMREWVWAGASSCSHVGTSPGPEWEVAWLRPDASAPLRGVIHHYGERTRTQTTWADWHSIDDSRAATRLLERDLTVLGLPLPLVRWWLAEQP